MAIRTVRLDAETERALAEVRAATGMPISEALKLGLRELQRRLHAGPERTPFDVYQELDLGPGGYARAPSTAVISGVRQALRHKHRR